MPAETNSCSVGFPQDKNGITGALDPILCEVGGYQVFQVEHLMFQQWEDRKCYFVSWESSAALECSTIRLWVSGTEQCIWGAVMMAILDLREKETETGKTKL